MKRPGENLGGPNKKPKPVPGSFKKPENEALGPQSLVLTSQIWPRWWLPIWRDSYKNYGPHYGFSIDFPNFTHWIMMGPIASQEYHISELVYPDSEQIQVFKSFMDQEIYRKFTLDSFIELPQIQKDDPFYTTKRHELMTNQVKEWISNPTNASAMFRYFNNNMYQQLNFFGLSVDSSQSPAFFVTPIEAPEEWKQMILINFIQKFLTQTLRPTPRLSYNLHWKVPPKDFIAPKIFNDGKLEHFLKDRHTDKDIRHWFADFAIDKIFFPIKKERALDQLEILIKARNEMVLQYAYQHIDGLHTYDVLIGLAEFIQRSIFEEVFEKASLAYKEELMHVLEEIRPLHPNLQPKTVDKMETINHFKQMWKNTALGDTIVDKIANTARGEQKTTQWPPVFGVNMAHPPGKVESDLLKFMLANPPHKLKIPPIDFWTLNRKVEGWERAFERQWQDYLIWCEHNVQAMNAKHYVRPGEILKDNFGKLKTDIHGNYLYNQFPDYGLMDLSDSSSKWYRYIPLMATYVGDFLWGSDFWTWVEGTVKEIFHQVLQALKDILVSAGEAAVNIFKDIFGDVNLNTLLFYGALGIGAFYVGTTVIEEGSQRLVQRFI